MVRLNEKKPNDPKEIVKRTSVNKLNVANNKKITHLYYHDKYLTAIVSIWNKL